MIYQIGLVIEVTSTQKAAALRDKVANYLANDPDAELITWSAARNSPRWDVWGVDTNTDTAFHETKDADTESEVRAMYATPKVVAAIRAQR